MTGLSSPTLELPREELAALCRRYRITELSIFGSALRDDFRPESDFDLLVEFEPGAKVTFLSLGAMEQELEMLLGRRIDLILKDGLKPLIRKHVLNSARVLYAA